MPELPLKKFRMNEKASAVVVIFYKGQEHTVRFSNLKTIGMDSEIGERADFGGFEEIYATGTKSLTLTGEVEQALGDKV
jgi:hypothetical protein